MVSVIVPIYNAGSFLEYTIDSVFRQTFTEWELILVDDGSTDRSGNICDEAARICPKVKVIHKRNGGLSSARNAGLDEAVGEYIFFLDADDLLSPVALEVLFNNSISSKCDIVCGKISRFHSFDKLSCDRIKTSTSYKISHIHHTPENALTEILYQKSIDNSICGKLYASRIWKDYRFREGTGYEDLDIIYKVVMKANRIGSIRLPLYFYRQHSRSYIHTFDLRRSDVLDVTQRMVDYIDMNNPSLSKAARSRQLSANFNILLLFITHRGYIKKNGMEKESYRTEKRCKNKIKELRTESLRNPYVRLKNKIGIILSYFFI